MGLKPSGNTTAFTRKQLLAVRAADAVKLREQWEKRRKEKEERDADIE